MNLSISPSINPKPAKSMLAATIVAPGRIEMQRIPLPVPNTGQVRVRMEGCGVCASNIPVWEGKPWFTYPFAPGSPGHEGWGHVDAIGDGVTGFAPGDRVAILSCNAYAEYDLAPATSLLKLPDRLDGAPFPGEPMGCAMNIFRRSGIQKNDTVAIVGIGFLGALLTRLISKAGARVIAISKRAFSLEIAERMGAWKTLPIDDERKLLEKIATSTADRLCDVVIEATGKQYPLDLAAQLTRERGRLVIAGYHQDGLRQVNLQLWNWRGLDVINAHERDTAIYLEGMRLALDAMLTGELDTTTLLTHRFPLCQLEEALAMTAQRPAGFMKAVISF